MALGQLPRMPGKGEEPAIQTQAIYRGILVATRFALRSVANSRCSPAHQHQSGYFRSDSLIGAFDLSPVVPLRIYLWRITEAYIVWHHRNTNHMTLESKWV